MVMEVIVVDEDEDVLDVLQAFLSREDNLSISTEADPEHALERISTGEFDAVVSDLTMPKLDGIELAHEVHDAVDGIPFFLFTGRDPADIDGYEDAPITDHLQKGTGTEQYSVLAEKIEASVDE